MHMQRGVTVRALVRLAGDRGERISESVEIHLGEVKLVGARGRIIIWLTSNWQRAHRSAAKLGERCAGIFLYALGFGAGKNEAPASRGEDARPGGSFVRGS